MTLAQEVSDEIIALADVAKSAVLARFFRTGKGEYAEGDKFLGVMAPQTRMVVKAARLDVPLAEIETLLESPYHEVRLAGLLLLVEEAKAAEPKPRDTPEATLRKAHKRKELCDFYLAHAHCANNWDLVDVTCPHVVGEWFAYPLPDGSMPDRSLLDRLAADSNLWVQRIAIVSTLALCRRGELADTYRIAELLLGHSHHLIHKAVGWLLREMGKRDIEFLRHFLDKHHAAMPRTALRYAVERMDVDERKYWMTLK